MSVFNASNRGFEEKSYPLFFGEDLGLFDTVNCTYPEIERLYQQQVSQVWYETEVDLTQDRQDMQQVPKEVSDLMIKTISWQHLADSVAARSIPSILLKHCTNSELEGMILAQSFFEVIHSRSYSHIVKQTFSDPQQMLRETYNNMDVLKRGENIVRVFDWLDGLSDDTSIEEKRRAMLQGIFALMALEGIAFMASFAVTFGVVETDVFQGIGASVALICRDEALHTNMDYTILEILFRDKGWQEALVECKEDVKKILDDVIAQEIAWSDYIFSEGRKVVGLNADLLKEYVYHMAKPLYDGFGITYNHPVVEENPLPYMDAYVDPTKFQSAAQEINITSYNIGAISDDTEGLDLSDLDF